MVYKAAWPAGGGAIAVGYEAAWPAGGGAIVMGYAAAWPASGAGGGAEVAGSRAVCVSPWGAGVGGSPTDQPCLPATSCIMAKKVGVADGSRPPRLGGGGGFSSFDFLASLLSPFLLLLLSHRERSGGWAIGRSLSALAVTSGELSYKLVLS